MKEDVAWEVIRTAFRNSSELQVLLKNLKENCEANEYSTYARAIATVVDALNVQLISRVVSEHPVLGEKIESNLRAFGRID